MWVQSLGQEDALKEGMATHSSILACRIPWAGKPGGLQSMRLQRAGHNCATNRHTATRNDHKVWFSATSFMGFPAGTSDKEPIYQWGRHKRCGFNPWFGKSSWKGHGNSPCLENPMDRGAWWATVHGVTESQTRLSDWADRTRHS